MIEGGAVAREYAHALWELGRERKLFPDLLEELRSLRDLVAKDVQVRGFFESPRRSREDKLDSLGRNVGRKVSDVTLSFLRVLVRKGREAELRSIVDALEEMIEREKDQVRVNVTSPATLAPDVKTRLETALASRLGRPVILNEEVDPDLLGGLVVRVGDLRLDASVRTQLKKLRARALEAPLEGKQS
jgi:F-type H+-transporting ATPase subunit delta